MHKMDLPQTELNNKQVPKIGGGKKKINLYLSWNCEWKIQNYVRTEMKPFTYMKKNSKFTTSLKVNI